MSISPILSTSIEIESKSLLPKISDRSLDIQIAALNARQHATYSPSHDELATQFFLLDLQLTAPPAIINIYALVKSPDS